jgi:preprotein translocase subunit SecA
MHRPLVLGDREAQLHRAVEEVACRHSTGQPVLVGTRTVEMSERFSALLKDRGIGHQLLNARQDAEEAAIVAKAGRAHAVTVATNMAGRGTDIPLDDEAGELGGLHVISLEANESQRVERQLFGRSARQGDPGSAQSIVSLEDELVRGALPRKALQLVALGARRLPIAGAWLSRATVRCSQWLCERRHRTQRLQIYNGSEALNRRLAVGGDME